MMRYEARDYWQLTTIVHHMKQRQAEYEIGSDAWNDVQTQIIIREARLEKMKEELR